MHLDEGIVLIRVAQQATNSLCFALMITHLHLHQRGRRKCNQWAKCEGKTTSGVFVLCPHLPVLFLWRVEADVVSERQSTMRSHVCLVRHQFTKHLFTRFPRGLKAPTINTLKVTGNITGTTPRWCLLYFCSYTNTPKIQSKNLIQSELTCMFLFCFLNIPAYNLHRWAPLRV